MSSVVLWAVAELNRTMKKPKKIMPEDWGFVPVDPSPNFSAEHNRRVVDEVIRDGEATKRKKDKEYMDQLGERSAATAQYLKSLQKGSTSNAEKYFGRKYLAHLTGRQKLEQIKKAYAKKEKESQAQKIQ